MGRQHTTIRLVVMLVVGVIATLVTGSFGEWARAPTVGWSVAALIYSSTVWLRVARPDPAATRAHASREGPARGIADPLVILLSVARISSVAYVLVQADRGIDFNQDR